MLIAGDLFSFSGNAGGGVGLDEQRSTLIIHGRSVIKARAPRLSLSLMVGRVIIYNRMAAARQAWTAKQAGKYGTAIKS